MTRLVDLDDLAGLAAAVSELERHRGVVGEDPFLWLSIVRRCQKLDPAVAAPVLAALNEMHPEVVLEVHFDVLVGDLLDRPALGHFRRQVAIL